MDGIAGSGAEATTPGPGLSTRSSQLCRYRIQAPGPLQPSISIAMGTYSRLGGNIPVRARQHTSLVSLIIHPRGAPSSVSRSAKSDPPNQQQALHLPICLPVAGAVHHHHPQHRLIATGKTLDKGAHCTRSICTVPTGIALLGLLYSTG